MDDIDWGHLLFGFSGRINRVGFWAGMVLVYAVIFSTVMIGFAVNQPVMWGIVSIVNLVTISMWVAISIKRWHDRGKSGWWILIVFVPVIGYLWMLIETGFLVGDDGPNDYGPDPLAAAPVTGE